MTLRRLLTVCFSAYAGKIFLLILGIITGLRVHTQTIEYSRQNFKTPYSDAIQLVADVAGYSHLLCFTADENIVLYIYNDNLQLQAKKGLQIKLNLRDEVNIIPFKKFYFLYLHRSGSSEHRLWKIDRDGNTTAVSNLFRNLIDTAFRKNTATLQLANKGNRLCVLGNTYFDELGKIGTTVVQADENLKIGLVRRVLYDFKKYEEGLQQVTLVGDDLFILKTSRDSVGHLLQMMKANLNTGELLINYFNSGAHLYSNPTFTYNSADSGIIIHSMIERTVFIVKLDYWLNEKVPVTLLKAQFKNNTAVNFLQIPGSTSGWLRMRLRYQSGRLFAGGNGISRSGLNSPFDANSGFDVYGNLVLNNYRYGGSNVSSYRITELYPPASNNSYSDASAVRFSLLSKDFKIVKDSFAVNDKRANSIQPAQFASIVLQNKSYLFLGQQFGSNRQGLLMMSGNNNGELLAKDIRVYDKYEYLLPQLQAVNDKYVIVPYQYKRELGLVKITLE